MKPSVNDQTKFELRRDRDFRTSARFWTAAALCRFLSAPVTSQSGRGLPHSKTLARGSVVLLLALAISSSTTFSGRSQPVTNAPAPRASVLPAQKDLVRKPAALDFVTEFKHRAKQRYDSRWSFEQDQPGSVPKGWQAAQTGVGELAKWAVTALETSSEVAARGVAVVESLNKGNTFNLLLADGVSATDLTLRTDLKAVSGAGDQGGGLIWRVQDTNNYYLARWNPLESNLRVYTVIKGKRTQLANVNVEADAAGWHELSIKQVGDVMRVEFDRTRMVCLVDTNFPGAGGVGLWTKADAATAFRDVRLTTARAGVVLTDTLTGATLGRQAGGDFVAGGWSAQNDGDRIVWELPPMPHGGRIELDFRNFNPPKQTTAANNIFLGLWGTLFENREHTEDPADQVDVDNYEMRMGTAWGAQFKFEYHASGAATVARWTPFQTYDPEHTYHFKVEWRDGVVTTTLDDQVLNFNGLPPRKDGQRAALEPLLVDRFNFLHLGTSSHFGGKATAGPVYSNLKITAFNAEAPGDMKAGSSASKP